MGSRRIDASQGGEGGAGSVECLLTRGGVYSMEKNSSKDFLFLRCNIPLWYNGGQIRRLNLSWNYVTDIVHEMPCLVKWHSRPVDWLNQGVY